MNCRKTKAYTLIEILIALAVFALLAVITSSVMYYAFNTRSRVNLQADRLNQLQASLTLMSRDMRQVTNRFVHGNDIKRIAPFVGKNVYVEFTRGGYTNPQAIERRSTLKRIGYLCEKNRLIRRSWPMLDSPIRSQYRDKTMLDNLSECSFKYVARNKQTLPTWQAFARQQNQNAENLPTAIRLDIKLKAWGEMNLLFILPGALYGE